MLLIIDNNPGICKYFDCENVFINPSDSTILETLHKINNNTNVEKIYFPLELKFHNTQRQHLQGLELLKHIRLTTELRDLQYAPILFGYTYPLEAVLRNPESTILCSPATHLFNLKNIHLVNCNCFFRSEEILTKEILKPYVLYTDNHDSRNKQGPLKLANELNQGPCSQIELDLWQKKILFLLQDVKKNEAIESISDSDFKNTIKGKRILYLDDEADKWEKPLKQFLQGAAVSIINSYSEIQLLCDEIMLAKQSILEDYKKQDAEIYFLLPEIEKLKKILLNKRKELSNIQNELNAKKGESELLKKERLSLIQEAQALSSEYGDRIANFLFYENDKLDDADIVKAFILLSNKIKFVKDNQDAIRKINDLILINEKKSQDLQTEINLIAADLNAKSKVDLKYYNEYVDRLSSVMKYDLIILDLYLNPVSDNVNFEASGINVLRVIKKFNPHIPVLIFTSSQSQKNIKSARQYVDDAYWIKNVNHLDFLKVEIVRLLRYIIPYEQYWKYELIKSRENITGYEIIKMTTKEPYHIYQKQKMDLIHIIEIFINFLKVDDYSLESIKELWRKTHMSQELRIFKYNNIREHDIKCIGLDNIELDIRRVRNFIVHNLNEPNVNLLEKNFQIQYINHTINFLLGYR
jgi:CheY-like chemotaxis protein